MATNLQVCEISDKIESKEGKYGMGIYATEALEEDEVLLKIEPKDLITVEMLFEVHHCQYRYGLEIPSLIYDTESALINVSASKRSYGD